ncbi:MAG: SsrA-binding protein SmpB [Bdellovibrionota bacterium]
MAKSSSEKGGGKNAAEGGGILIVAQNKRARHDYEIMQTAECGIVLSGPEVKSIRDGHMNLKESYVQVHGGEVFLIGCNIKPYAHSRLEEQDADRERKLLMHRREIERLAVQVNQKGLTIVPLKAYFKAGRCKVEIGIGRGKKLHDKRDDLKRREADREMARAMKYRS